MISTQKFKSLVHFVCASRADAPETLGAVKLNKILWLADINSFYERGKPVTESRYIKQRFGPVPARIVPVLRELEREGILSVTEAKHFGKQKKEYVVHVAADGSFLSKQERAIVERVIDNVCDKHTARSVSEMSHDHIWEAAAEGEEIPHYTVFAKPGEITDSERMWAQLQLDSE